MGARVLNLGGRAAFDALVSRLRAALAGAELAVDEMRRMLEASFLQLNTEFGFAFALLHAPVLTPFAGEISLIEQNYGRYLTLGQAWRMAAPGFAEQFCRVLLSKLRVVFENAAGEVELWSKGASSQMEVQLRERRRGFARRREALLRVQAAAGELEERITEVQSQDEYLAQLQNRLDGLAGTAIAAARSLAAERIEPALQLHLHLQSGAA